jgi:hypothetical protein
VAGGRNVEVARNYKENRYREMPVAVRWKGCQTDFTELFRK